VKERLARLKAIQEFIQTQKIESQEMLVSLLQSRKIKVTQATLSRDLKSLKVGKIADENGAYVYVLPESGGAEDTESENANIRNFLQSYTSIAWSGNVVIVKTRLGYSDPVSLALDSFNMEEVLGTITGKDNAVAVFLKQGFSGEDFMKSLSEIIPELKNKL